MEQKVTFQELLRMYGIEYREVKNNEIRIRCPFHEDKRPSCTINIKKNVFYCFPCSTGGGVVKFVMMKENCDRLQAIKILRQRTGINIRENKQYVEPKKEVHEIVSKVVNFELNKHFKECELKNEKMDGQFIYGLLTWAVYYNPKALEREWYITKTEIGKLEQSTFSVYRSCIKKIRIIESITKGSIDQKLKKELFELHKLHDEGFFEKSTDEFWKYVEMRNMKEVLKDELMKYGMLLFRYSRKNKINELEKLRKRIIEFYFVLLDMVNHKSEWLKDIQKIDWLGAV